MLIANSDLCSSQPLTSPLIGCYQHYKGQHYQLIGIATHSESREQLAIYHCLYGDFSTWARPLSMFLENVCLPDGQIVPRFQLIDADKTAKTVV